jgi:uncharacterized protein YggE
MIFEDRLPISIYIYSTYNLKLTYRMRTIFTFLILLFCIKSYGQQKNFIDQPYLETNGSVDTLIVPDRIYISIMLNEADSKNKKSTEELENTLEKTLKKLNINTEKDLTLLDYSSNFKNYLLKAQNILKTKNYSLKVYDAVTAGKVLAMLEDAGISNVNIESTEYSKADELVLELKSKAVQNAKTNAKKLLEPLGQKLGKAIFITDNNSTVNALKGKVSGIQIRGATSLYGSVAAEPILVEFKKLKFEAQVQVKFIIE